MSQLELFNIIQAPIEVLSGPCVFPISQERAGWIRDVVMTARRRQTLEECPALADCACHYGVSGRCADPNRKAHRKCRALAIETPAGHMVMTSGTGECVIADFYETGHRHVWRCSCTCHNEDCAQPRLTA